MSSKSTKAHIYIYIMEPNLWGKYLYNFTPLNNLKPPYLTFRNKCVRHPQYSTSIMVVVDGHVVVLMVVGMVVKVGFDVVVLVKFAMWLWWWQSVLVRVLVMVLWCDGGGSLWFWWFIGVMVVVMVICDFCGGGGKLWIWRRKWRLAIVRMVVVVVGCGCGGGQNHFSVRLASSYLRLSHDQRKQ